MTTWLKCAECNEMFEVSNEIAEAMHHWREESGDPFLCVDCATRMAWGDAISAIDGECTDTLDEIPVGGNSERRFPDGEPCCVSCCRRSCADDAREDRHISRRAADSR